MTNNQPSFCSIDMPIKDLKKIDLQRVVEGLDYLAERFDRLERPASSGQAREYLRIVNYLDSRISAIEQLIAQGFDSAETIKISLQIDFDLDPGDRSVEADLI